MKNYQQTVKVRRANLEKAKRELRHSNPKRVFTQEYISCMRVNSKGQWVYGTVKNRMVFRGSKL